MSRFGARAVMALSIGQRLGTTQGSGTRGFTLRMSSRSTVARKLNNMRAVTKEEFFAERLTERLNPVMQQIWDDASNDGLDPVVVAAVIRGTIVVVEKAFGRNAPPDFAALYSSGIGAKVADAFIEAKLKG